MSTTAIWLMAYLAAVFLFLLKYLGKSSAELYSVNRRQTGTALLVFTTLATTIGGGVIIGLIAIGYEAGLAGFFMGLAYGLGLLVTGYFAPRIHRYARGHGIVSFPNFLNHRYYGERRGRFNYLVTLVNMFIFFFLLAAQFVAMGILIREIFGLHYNLALIISALVVIAYTVMAGLRGVIVTDAIQFVLISVVTFALFLPRALSMGSGNWNLLPESHFLGTGYGAAFLVALFLFFMPSTIVRLEIWQRVIAARSARAARRACVLSGLLLLPFYAVFPLIGMAVRTLEQPISNPDSVAYFFIHSSFSGHLEGIIFVGLLAALMSSGDSFLNILSVSAAKDLGVFCPQRLWKAAVNPGRNRAWADARVVRVLRMNALFLGLLALSIAVILPDLVDLLVVASTSVVIFTPAAVAALMKRGRLRVGPAFWSVASGFVVNIIVFTLATLGIIGFEPKSSFVPAFLAALAAYLLLEGRARLSSRN
jgi:SSS family solute:Na+ symporter